jgi:hypothetical protein
MCSAHSFAGNWAVDKFSSVRLHARPTSAGVFCIFVIRLKLLDIVPALFGLLKSKFSEEFLQPITKFNEWLWINEKQITK